MNAVWIHTAYHVAVGIGILYAVSVYRNRNPERFSSAYRVALTIVLVYLLWALIPNVRAYADLVIRPTRGSRATMAKQRKLSQADLEAALIRVQQVAPNAGLRCTRADRDWDYVCSYMPTPLQSKTRLEFGVIVDEKRWVNVSRIVPAGTMLPPPR
jgi:hypothetical protein